MFDIKKAAAVAAVATLALAATDLSASAQSSLTNGPNGAQPNTLASDTPGSNLGKAPSRQIYRRQPVRTVRAGRNTYAGDHRPLTVRRTAPAVVEAPAAVAAPVVGAPFASGPGAIITGPLGFASNVFSLPFQAINGIFPATGDIATNPLVIIGGPLHAVGDIVQVPLRVLGAPFGGTTIATY